MWVQGYQNNRSSVRPWLELMTALRETPLSAHSDDLRTQLHERLTVELARDPEEEEVLSTNQLIEVMETLLIQQLPWYGGAVLSFTNRSLTGWAPSGGFLTQRSAPIDASVDGIMDAVAVLPAHLRGLQAAFTPARAAIVSGQLPVNAIEGVLDHVIAATACRGEWQQTLCASFLWMHEACGVPLPEQRRAAIRDWLRQLCPAGYSPEPMTRAEILSAMIRSLQRPARW